ncbi:PP2C family protein-serine/threonine phosphatase [Gulosibacter macacae]|uniref:PP2C family protein-serine/threonine phosphatase n=1 Tax=Gulosibacter macacae TaxID=2488791 RepID=UPI001F251DD2|nr:protein phosphatase 2C domain-containing protein [Gulosibacter macacae]
MSTDFSTTIATCAGDLEVRGSATSDVGVVRIVNEDAFFARPPVFLVADGMGGHAYGDRASRAVAEVFDEWFPEATPTTPAEVIAAIDASNDRVQALVTEEDGPGVVAGTTVTGLALVEVDPAGDGAVAPHWMIFNVGDSRVYGWNGRDVVQITVDHSAVQELVHMGVLTPEEALIHPDRNVITRAVGSEAHVDTDLWLMPVQGHQVFIICSDGLTKELEDEDIAAVVRDYVAEEEPTESLSEVLVRKAIQSGGRDNISVVVLESSALGRDGVEAPADSGVGEP